MSTTIDRITELGILPVVVLEDAGQATDLAGALIEGGLPVAEITFRTKAAAGAIAAMSSDPRILVGAGTVVTVEQVDRAVEAGARFVVSPGFSHAVVLRCAELGVVTIPGAVTATEIMAALDAGLSLVKFFPAGSSGGPGAVKSLSAPFAGLGFVPTGGIDASNVSDYFAVPSVRAVGGSWMVPPVAISSGDFDLVRDLVASSVSAVRLARAVSAR
jgi:2-dehydro-3-deoxyphosphogluconate aldolase/(4S)-4-hydroxy-2-oxoglutarate aldolase